MICVQYCFVVRVGGYPPA
jgi:hypothetical protein